MFGGYTNNNPPILNLEEERMEIKMITSSDEIWNKVRNYANECSWKAGKSLANSMDKKIFSEWERVIVAIDKNVTLCGYCTVAKRDCIPMWIILLILVICLLMKNIGEIGLAKN